jgi:hypothetical protein
MKEHGHEHVGLGHYLAFGARLGITGMARLGLRFARAVGEMFKLRRGHLSEAAKLLRADNEARVAKLAAVTRLGLDRLRALLSLQASPITSSVRGIMASVLLDRLAVAFVAVTTLLVIGTVALFGGVHATTAWVTLGVVAAWVGLHIYFSRRRTVDPADAMVERAAHLAKLFPAAVAAGAATYINVGSWAEDADDPPASDDGAGEGGPSAAGWQPALAYRAARTHLVIHVRHERGVSRAEAHFCTWEDEGPQRRVLPT